MDLLKQTKKICNQYNIKPTHSKGQNFLINESIYNKIIESADLKKDDIVLEVGPGLGFLTEKLSKKVKKVIAVELDDKLVEALHCNASTVLVINKNILDINPKELGLENNNFKIVANLPYNITSFFLRKFLSSEIKPSLMVLMLQKEVVERICAKPPKMSLLAVSVQYYANPKKIQNVSANYFWPKPKIDSAIIELKVKSKKLKVKSSEDDFFKLVKAGFSSKRKMLKNNLSNYYNINQKEIENKLKKNNFNPKIRAQELSVDDWKKIFGEL